MVLCASPTSTKASGNSIWINGKSTPRFSKRIKSLFFARFLVDCYNRLAPMLAEFFDMASIVAVILDRTPFQIVHVAVGAVLVYVVDLREILRIRDESLRYKAMDIESLDLVAYPYTNLNIPSCRDGSAGKFSSIAVSDLALLVHFDARASVNNLPHTKNSLLAKRSS
jgi:hypothetical protein